MRGYSDGFVQLLGTTKVDLCHVSPSVQEWGVTGDSGPLFCAHSYGRGTLDSLGRKLVASSVLQEGHWDKSMTGGSCKGRLDRLDGFVIQLRTNY